jgi:hypothetical protein
MFKFWRQRTAGNGWREKMVKLSLNFELKLKLEISIWRECSKITILFDILVA